MDVRVTHFGLKLLIRDVAVDFWGTYSSEFYQKQATATILSWLIFKLDQQRLWILSNHFVLVLLLGLLSVGSAWRIRLVILFCNMLMQRSSGSVWVDSLTSQLHTLSSDVTLETLRRSASQKLLFAIVFCRFLLNIQKRHIYNEYAL